VLLPLLTGTATTATAPLPLHGALPIWGNRCRHSGRRSRPPCPRVRESAYRPCRHPNAPPPPRRACFVAARQSSCSPRSVPERKRSEEHTSELQSREKLVCRLLLEKKNS